MNPVCRYYIDILVEIMNLLQWRNKIVTPEFDYNTLMSALSDVAYPRDKISDLIKKSIVIRVKKGIYVLGPVFGRPYSKHVLANMIYGPSYISDISALSVHGLIPERTTVICSVTPNRNKHFETPVGVYKYKYCSMKKFSVSVIRKSVDEFRAFLVSTPEKAVIESLINQRIETEEGISDWFESMRFPEIASKKLRVVEFDRLSLVFNKNLCELLKKYVRTVKHA